MVQNRFLLAHSHHVATATIAVRWLLDSEIGVVNRLLAMLNLPTQSWLNQEGWAMSGGFGIGVVLVRDQHSDVLGRFREHTTGII